LENFGRNWAQEYRNLLKVPSKRLENLKPAKRKVKKRGKSKIEKNEHSVLTEVVLPIGR
jgi:hypothetical protein